MKVTFAVLSLALFAQHTIAAWSLSKAIYDKWHESELERWLSDHNIPYPSPSDRKDLQNRVKENWESYAVSPYQSWDTRQQVDWLSRKGVEVSDKQAQNKDWLVAEIKKKWYDTEADAEEEYGDVKNWLFDTWTDSQLKSFLDYHGIPSPHPRTRDALLSTARSNYATIAQKAGETAAYPGDWVYSTWSDSDLKSWLDSHGYSVPQGSKRNELIAAVRRNSRLAKLKFNDVKDSVADSIFESWSDSQLKEWFDKNDIAVPQNGKRDELLALARKHKASLTGDTFSASVTSAYGAATSKVGEQFTGATDAAYNTASDAYHSAADYAMSTWSDSRLKAYLDSRGVPVPQNGKRDELLAKARLHKHKAANLYNAWTFDTWTVDNLKAWLKKHGQAASDTVSEKTPTPPSREELVSSASAYYASASASGGSAYASVTSALAQATDAAKDTTFETWSDSDLKSYLDSYGVKTYQGTTKNEMIAKARRCAQIFKDGWTQETAWQRFQRQGWSTFNTLRYYLGIGPSVASDKTTAAASSASSAASSATSRVKNEL